MKDIVFVIGAGASQDFGLPLGSGLAATIRDGLNLELQGPRTSLSYGVLDYFAMRGGLSGAHKAAARELADGLMMSNSIDELIGFRPDLAGVGKVAIANQIIRAEAASTLADLDPYREADQRTAFTRARDSWLGAFWLNFVGPRRGEDVLAALSRFGFVTFNYDRCIELFMLSALQLVARLDAEAARSALDDLDVHHVYGSLGQLPPRVGGVSYGSEWQYGMAAADAIRTFRESFADGEFAKVQALLNQARIIVFIGYGFADENNQRLFPDGYDINLPTYVAAGPAPSWALDRISAYVGTAHSIVRGGDGASLFQDHGHRMK